MAVFPDASCSHPELLRRYFKTLRIGKHDYFTGRVEKLLDAAQAGSMRDVSCMDLHDVAALEQGILLSMDSFAQVRPLRRIGPCTWLFGTVREATGCAVVPRAGNAPKAIGENTANLQLITRGP